jgi:hypothetical protein
MLKALLIFAVTVGAASLARAESLDRKACVDNVGGTYTLLADGSLTCENSLCGLKGPLHLSQLRAIKTVNSAGISGTENQMATTLNMLVGHKDSSIINGGTPTYYAKDSTELFCSSAFSADDYESQDIRSTLAFFSN